MNDADYEIVDDKLYVRPETHIEDSDQFINALRNTQAAENQRIVDQTANLGGFGYTEPRTENTNWVNKYQRPIVDAAVAEINAVARQNAMNQAGNNIVNQLKAQYDEAYKAAKARAAAASSGSGGGGGTTTLQGFDVNATDDSAVRGFEPGTDGIYTKDSPSSDGLYVVSARSTATGAGNMTEYFWSDGSTSIYNGDGSLRSGRPVS